MGLRGRPAVSLSDAYERFLEQDFARISVADVLGAVVAEAENVEVTRHPLGFHHVELTSLVDAPVGERFRLHLWLDDHDVSDGLGDLHEHTWHLTLLSWRGALSTRISLPRQQRTESTLGPGFPTERRTGPSK